MGPDECIVEHVLSTIGTKWTPRVVDQLRGGTKRYSQVRRGLRGISARVLTERLRTLEELGMVERSVYAEVPVRVEYTLTPRGEELVAILDRIGAWGHDLDAHQRAVLGLAPVRDAVPAPVVLRAVSF